MSIDAIRKALQKHLKDLATFPTAKENSPFTPPQDGAAWQKCVLMPAEPESVMVGAQMEKGIFQITLHYPLGEGTGEAERKADVVANHFKRATTLVTDGGIRVHVTHQPKIASGIPVNDRWVVPVSVRYHAYVTNSA